MKKTAWEKIYVRYRRTGKKWASLRDPVHASFVRFMKRTKFDLKSALDLGCGNGKYLKFLQDNGFGVAGVDSSPTGIRLSRKALGKKVDLRMGDIYTSHIAPKKYDLIISVAAIQHARKNVIQKLIDRIHASLPVRGKIFITFPRMSSLRRWKTFKEMQTIAPGTYIPLGGPEKGLPHSFYEKNELEKLFSGFQEVRIAKDDMGRWIVTGERGSLKKKERTDFLKK